MKALTFGIVLIVSAALPFTVGCKSHKSSDSSDSSHHSTITPEDKARICAPIPANACAGAIAQYQKVLDAKNDENMRIAAFPHGDPNVSDAQYTDLKSGYQLAALFYSLSSMPPDYEALASADSEEYRSASDQFRKRELMQALRPKIDAQLAAFKDPHNRYFRIVVSHSVPLGHYDFNSRSFPLNAQLDPDSYTYFNDAPNFKIAYSNGRTYEKFPVADEQRAKEIEAMVTKYETSNGITTAYLFVQGADTGNTQVTAQIMHVVLEQGHRELGRY